MGDMYSYCMYVQCILVLDMICIVLFSYMQLVLTIFPEHYFGTTAEEICQSLNLVLHYILAFVLVLTLKDIVTVMEPGHRLI